MTIISDNLLMKPSEGSASWVLGDLYTFKAKGEDTGKAYALIEIVMQPNNGVPPHVHTHENEAFYIQEGEMEFQLGEQTIVATPGTFLHTAKGQPHSFRNISTKPAKFLCWLTPAGLEEFFMEVGVPVSGAKSYTPAVTPADVKKLMLTAPKYGLEIISPSSAI